MVKFWREFGMSFWREFEAVGEGRDCRLRPTVCVCVCMCVCVCVCDGKLLAGVWDEFLAGV